MFVADLLFDFREQIVTCIDLDKYPLPLFRDIQDLVFKQFNRVHRSGDIPPDLFDLLLYPDLLIFAFMRDLLT